MRVRTMPPNRCCRATAGFDFCVMSDAFAPPCLSSNVGHIYRRDLMDESNQYFRATLLARETFERLQRAGLSAEDAKRLVAKVINTEEFALMNGRHSFDEARFTERLRQLPD